MRQWIILFTSTALLALPEIGRAQSPPSHAVDVGGFVSLDAHIGRINGRGAVTSGAEIALLLDHRFSLGLTGAALVNDDDDDAPGGTRDLRRFGYGGVSLGYVVAPASALHYLIDVLVAGGSVRSQADSAPDGDGDRIFVLQPSIAAEVSLSRHMRAAAGISYRAVSGVDSAGLSNADLRGFAVRLTVSAGKF